MFGEAAFAAAVVAFVGSVGPASVEVFVEAAVLEMMHQHQDEIGLAVAMPQRLRSLEPVV